MKVMKKIGFVLLFLPVFLQARVSKKQSAALTMLSKPVESNKSKGNRIQLTKAYHHKGAMADKLVFYFSHRPICTYVPSASAKGLQGEHVAADENGQVHLEFFLPITRAKKHAQKFLNQLSSTNNDLYKVRFEQDYAKDGLKCQVVFRPKDVGFHQESFEAITGEPALSFSFLKRKSMKSINEKVRPLIRSAQVKKKLMWRSIAGMGTVTRAL